MLLRAIALSLAIIIGVGGVVIPFGTQTVEASSRKIGRKKGYKKYSKKWWRQYRARQKKRRAMIARKRAMRLQQLRLAQAAGQDLETAAKNLTPKRVVRAPKAQNAERKLTTSKVLAAPVSPAVTVAPALRVTDVNDWNAAVTVVGPAVGESSMAKHARTVGGVATTSLRRGIIDQMIKENGWVVNDYQKLIAGRPVYVVIAQSQGAGGRVTSRMFHFTEVDGRIYSVATNSPVEQQDRLVAESEKVLDSIQSRVRNSQRAAVKD
jgi:hypothetical protein